MGSLALRTDITNSIPKREVLSILLSIPAPAVGHSLVHDATERTRSISRRENLGEMVSLRITYIYWMALCLKCQHLDHSFPRQVTYNVCHPRQSGFKGLRIPDPRRRPICGSGQYCGDGREAHRQRREWDRTCYFRGLMAVCAKRLQNSGSSSQSSRMEKARKDSSV